MSGIPIGWQLVGLGELCERIVDGSHNPPKASAVGKPMLSARNIDDFTINFDDYRLISDVDFDLEHSRTRIASGDVLLTIVGTIGRTAVVPEKTQEFALQRSVAVLKLLDVESARYVAHAISAPETQQWLQDKAKGTAQKGVYLKTLSTLPIKVAPAAEQTRIVAKLEELLSDLDAGVAELGVEVALLDAVTVLHREALAEDRQRRRRNRDHGDGGQKRPRDQHPAQRRADGRARDPTRDRADRDRADRTLDRVALDRADRHRRQSPRQGRDAAVPRRYARAPGDRIRFPPAAAAPAWPSRR